MSKNGKDVANKVSVDLTMFEGQDTGFEGTDATTFKTPFLKVLQSLSPELKKTDPKYIPEAEAGLFCNSASQELYTNLNVIVVKVEHSLIVWGANRGGFVGRFPKGREEELVASKEGLKKWDIDGNEIVDTIEFFCINADNPSDIFVFPLSTTSLKHAKSFATRLRMLKADGKPVYVSWAGVWNIQTVEESNDKGSWYTLGNTPSFVRFVTKDEIDSFILPTKEMLKTAEADYSAINPTKSEDDEDDNDVSY